MKPNLLNGVQEDAPLPDTSQRETDLSSVEYSNNELLSEEQDVMSPAPVTRIVAQDDDFDLLGESEEQYYDSGEE